MSREGRSIALIEDDPIMGESLVQRLALDGIAVKWWRNGRDAVAGIGTARFDAVVCDIRLPDMTGEDLFKETGLSTRTPPFLFITGHGDIDQAVRLMRAGAADYLTKPFEIEKLLARLGEIVRPGSTASGVLGLSPAAKTLERLLLRLASLNSTVLLTGETGSGKEVAARFLHASSSRNREPFMAVNCAAIPAHLLESELFGHERGAFTGATQRHLGYAERTGKGVLFLDEIGELHHELQAKLLRLIEDRTFHRVGGERTLPFEGRLATATNADLLALVKADRFREDLYYRVNVVSVEVPALRDRPDDIVWLMEKFFIEHAAAMESRIHGFSVMAEEAARMHDWPGNIRELRNRVERAVALGEGPWIMPADLFPEYAHDAGRGDPVLQSLENVRQDAERRHILRALASTGGEIGAASKLLGIGRTTLWDKMKRLGLSPDA
ncbi:MAG: sigma-54-dependent Fis family transcriptional regulator [Alphaproteobacteria bacterium]|nr:sigma-54-dependent Fis family transcriptional regulator [Alphaproteobacteria bacterium]